MLIVYYSKTGKVKNFVDKLAERGFVCKCILEHDVVNEDFVLITPTYGYGDIPNAVENFLEKNSSYLKAVASSGNMIWGLHLFARSGDKISQKYNVPLLHKFQNHGFDSDVDIIAERVLRLGELDST